MKILFITHKYPPSIGGMEKQSYELVKGISAMHETICISYDQNSASKLSFFLGLRSRVKEILKMNPDIGLIHLNDGLMVAFTLWLKKLTDIPVVATVHGLDILFPFFPYQKWILPQFNYLKKIIAVSDATATALIDRGIESDKVIVINNGVDTNSVNMSQKEKKARKKNNFLETDFSLKKTLLMEDDR